MEMQFMMLMLVQTLKVKMYLLSSDILQLFVIVYGIIEQKTNGQNAIFGVMLESHLNPGSQSIPSNPEDLKYGVSITDQCIGWDETENLIKWAYNEL